MTPQDWELYFTLLNTAGQQPTIINDAHAKVTPAAAGLPASPGRTTILNETARAEDANGKMGKALADLEKWGKKYQADTTGNPATPAPPDTGGGDTGGHVGSGPIKMEVLKPWGANEYGYREVQCASNTRYVIPFTVTPNVPVKDAAPTVRASLSSSSGNNPVTMEVLTDPSAATIIPGVSPGSNTPYWMGAWPGDAGKQLFLVFCHGHGGSGDIRPLIQLPTPK